jgi:hypothetical protein
VDSLFGLYKRRYWAILILAILGKARTMQNQFAQEAIGKVTIEVIQGRGLDQMPAVPKTAIVNMANSTLQGGGSHVNQVVTQRGRLH